MKNLLKLALCLFLFVGLWSCKHATWEDHYSSHSGGVIDKTLKEALEADPELTSFVGFLKECDYLDIFGHSQSYTIWAPTNAAWEGFDTSDKRNLLQTLKNHVSRFPYLSTDIQADSLSLRMLDNKVLVFHQDGEEYYFGSARLLSADKAYKNGILHKINAVEPYVKNIYEYIQLTPGLDSLKTFIEANQVKTFNASASLVLGVNAEGETIYDSVFLESNYVLEYNMGPVHEEGYAFTALLPTNEAWNDLYHTLEPYIVMAPFAMPLPPLGGTLEMDPLADSIRDVTVKEFITGHLVFNGIMGPEEIAAKTSMPTVSGAWLIRDMPDYFSDATGPINLSNGVAYTTNKLRLDPSYWCDTLKVEAELFYNHYSVPNEVVGNPDTLAIAVQIRENNSRLLRARDTYNSWMNNAISGHSYLSVTKTSNTEAPVVEFNLTAGTRSNVPYNVKVVFLPDRVFKEDKVNLKPVPVSFSMSYLNDEGSISTKNFSTVHYTDPMYVDTIDVTVKSDGVTPDPIALPFAQSLLTLKVMSQIKPNEDSVYARDMLIDCIILEPIY